MSPHPVTFFVIASCCFSFGSIVPDFHWTFDVSYAQEIFEVSSATDNVGALFNGTMIDGDSERYGSVAYFDGVNSGIFINNLTSSCFLDPGLCEEGLTFSFWLKRVKQTGQSFLSSQAVSIKSVSESMQVFDLWNGSKSWSEFLPVSPTSVEKWVNVLFTWDKKSLRIFENSVLLKDVTTCRDTRHGILATSALPNSSRLSFGRSSLDSDAENIPEMYMDDFKIWERPFSDKEVRQVYYSGIYDPGLFEIMDISEEPHFSYLANMQYATLDTLLLTETYIHSLTNCFKLCSTAMNCNVVGYKESSTEKICQIRQRLNGDDSEPKGGEGFHYYSVDRN